MDKILDLEISLIGSGEFTLYSVCISHSINYRKYSN